MLEEYLSRIATIIEGLHLLLEQADLPEENVQAIRAELDLMEHIISQYE